MWSYCRPEVIRFATLMETFLRENDHKDGWKGCSNQYLMTRMIEEMGELRETVNSTLCGFNPTEVAKEAADIANFAMMIADNYGVLPE